MKTYIVIAKHISEIKRVATWELRAESEIAAMQKIRTRDEVNHWPIGTIWETKEKKEVEG